MTMTPEKIAGLLENCENGIARITREDLVSLLALAERALEPQGQAQESSSGLLPCPFCGAAADDFNPDGEHEGYRINCSSQAQFMHADAAACPIHTFGYSTYEAAKIAWNRRASQIALPAGPVPEGWKLVPLESNDDMRNASAEYVQWNNKWKAALAAAPRPLPAVAQPDNTAAWESGELGRSAEHAQRAPAHIERQVSEAVAQPVADERDLARYRFLRLLPGMNIDELRAVQTAMDIFSRGEDRIPTPEEFDASVDAGIAARAALCQPAEEGGKS